METSANDVGNFARPLRHSTKTLKPIDIVLTYGVPERSESATAVHRRPGAIAYTFTGVLLYSALVTMVPLDLFLRLYQNICFRVWDIPLVKRGKHFAYDRARLPYLTKRERLHCLYCSYANGLASYFREILGRTEQYWCPIRHVRTPTSPHSRYQKFIAHNDAKAFRQLGDRVAEDFSDIQD